MSILERFLCKRTGKNTKTACKDTAIDNEIKRTISYHNKDITEPKTSINLGR